MSRIQGKKENAIKNRGEGAYFLLTFPINSVQDECSPAAPLRSVRVKSRLGLELQLLLGICTPAEQVQLPSMGRIKG